MKTTTLSRFDIHVCHQNLSNALHAFAPINYEVQNFFSPCHGFHSFDHIFYLDYNNTYSFPLYIGAEALNEEW